MNNISRVNKYGAEVWSNDKTDKIRKQECMCLNCKALPSCATTKELYSICKNKNLALMVTRCKDFDYILGNE